MRRSRPARRLVPTLSAATLCLLLLAACEDPSGVGLAVPGPDESDPRTQTIPAEIEIEPIDDITGAFLTNDGFASFRALAGRADDPVYGPVTAFAFVDVLSPQTLPEGFRDRPIEQAVLRLARTYVYGDTAAVTELELRQISGDWDAVGTPADTLFPVEDGLITTFEVAASDSLVEVPLPSEWIAANDTTLRSEQFSTLFAGFRIGPTDQAGAVYGFSGQSSLRLISEDDTVSYGASELFSGIDGPDEDPVVGPLVRLQDGTGRSLQLRFDAEDLGEVAIGQAFLRVTADTAAADPAAPNFVRTVAERLALFGFIEGEDPVLITTATLNEESQAFSFASPVLNDVFQDLVLGRSEIEGFAIGFPSSPSSLDVIPLVSESLSGCEDAETEPCRGPRAVILVVPTGG